MLGGKPHGTYFTIKDPDRLSRRFKFFHIGTCIDFYSIRAGYRLRIRRFVGLEDGDDRIKLFLRYHFLTPGKS